MLEDAVIHCLRAVGVRSPSDLAARRVVDVGCGDGRWLAYLERCGADPVKLTGVDLSKERIATARGRTRARKLVVGSAFELPFDDDVFDIALLTLVMHNVAEDALRATLADELVRVVRPGGAVLYCDMFGGAARPQFRPTRPAELAAWFEPLDVAAWRGTYLTPRIRRGRRILSAIAVHLGIGFQNRMYAIRITEAVKQRRRDRRAEAR
jgi:SAM-dependent methyltransferase